MKRPPLFLFDFGGTLNSDGDHWGALFRKMYERLYPDLGTDETESAYITAERRLSAEGLRNESFLETLGLQIGYQFEALGIDAPEVVRQESERFHAVAAERMARFLRLIVEHEGMLLPGIVSNFYGNIPAICEEFGVTRHLRVVVDSARVGLRKPEPAIWMHAIELAGYEPAETVVVGDSLKNDIRPAEALGCRTIWCRGLEWREQQKGDLEAVEVASTSELERAVLNIARTMS